MHKLKLHETLHIDLFMTHNQVPSAGVRAAGAAPADYSTIFTNAKAGMEGVDKERVKRIVFEMSKVRNDFHNLELPVEA